MQLATFFSQRNISFVMPSQSIPESAPSEDVTSALGERARPILDLVDGLRILGLQRDIPIPQVAVMGDQSSGKSSVLEALSGIPFPRGRGLVTRCATQISMGAGAVWAAEIRVGSKGDVVKVENPADITAQIEELTDQLCGSETFCADEIIEIKLRAPGSPELTIIDLPGIVRTATAGQSEEVIIQVDALLNRYLKQPRTVILAVIPAPSDIATVDIIERAAKVDPDGSRTMGVLTKPDLVDAGAEAEVLAVLDNVTKPLQHRYFMVKNRSQEETDRGVTLVEARVREKEWFSKSRFASRVKVLGVQALTSALTTLLLAHIQEALPSMWTEIEGLLVAAEKEVKALGEAAPENARSCKVVLSNMLRGWSASMRRVCALAVYSELKGDDKESLFVLRVQGFKRKKFSEQVELTKPGFDGEYDEFDAKVTKTRDRPSDNVHELHDNHRKVGDVVLNHHLPQKRSVTRVGEMVTFDYDSHGFEEAEITRVVSCFRGDLNQQIAINRGRELPGFMNFNVFKSLMANYISRWEPEAEKLRLNVSSVVKETALHFFGTHTHGHMSATKLQTKLSEVLCSYFGEMDTDAKGKMKDLLEQEMELPMTMNDYLFDTINKIRDERMSQILYALPCDGKAKVDRAAVLEALKSDVGVESNESQEVNDMLDMLQSYWKLSMKRYVDGICFIVSSAYTSDACLERMTRKLDEELVSGLDDVKVQELFIEPYAIISKRRVLEAKVERLTLALQRVRDFRVLQ